MNSWCDRNVAKRETLWSLDKHWDAALGSEHADIGD